MGANFILLHGGGHGGWCYQRVARLLRREGHEVYTPTLTGFGERAHLKAPDLTMETHILDVVNVFEFEDLRDVILVGHSLGGVVIPMVAERIPERIRRVVWLAAVVLEDGKSLLESVAPSPWIQRAVVRNPDGSIHQPTERFHPATWWR